MGLSDSFERHKRCERCHFSPCVCIERLPLMREVDSLRAAIERGLEKNGPLTALSIETEIIEYLKRVVPLKDVALLSKILGFK